MLNDLLKELLTLKTKVDNLNINQTLNVDGVLYTKKLFTN